MRAAILIAANFAREQRWPLFFLLLWVLGFAVFGFSVNSQAGAEDALMIFKQLALYGVAFAVFFGSSAVQSDLRSRRILAVLSKAVSRGQYLGGLLMGIGLILGTFCICLGISAAWLLGRYGLHLADLWLGILALFTACMLTASLALCLSVFLPPLFAAIGSGLLAGLPVILALRGMESLKYAIPIYGLLQPLVAADTGSVGHLGAGMIVVGWLQAVALAIAATWIFARRDLVVGVE